MEITSGTRLGPYEVISRIGAGGMGEVFKARDTRLDRSVAVKVLPPELTHNPQLRIRFEREAKTISQLSHPHICTLHDVGSEDGVSYLVMELLEGETLADRTARGPLPLHEVLRYGAQIADALGKAHRHGVIHRDLKPGNIMITRSGAKLLDFGLAKAAPLGGTPDGATIQKSITQEGTILGTFQYMAPEQLEGIEADPRTDIFALGAVLYEMATGRRAFEGKTRTSLIASIVSQQPRPLREVQPLTPPAFEHVVEKCLEKDPEDRWQNAQDIAEELRWIGSASSETAAPQATRRRSRERLAWALAGLFALLAAGAIAWSLTRPKPVRRVVRTTIDLPSDLNLSDSATNLSISSDGTRVAFHAFTPGKGMRLWVRHMDRLQPVMLTTAARSPAFSPDGAWIAFVGAGKLRKISSSGGATVDLADCGTNNRGVSWGGDGYIYYSPFPEAGIWRVHESGGEAKALTEPDRKRNENSHRWPQLLPGGKHLLMTVRLTSIATFDEAEAAVVSLETGKWETVLRGGSMVRYVPTGHLVFARNGGLHAIPFDLKTMRTSGTPVQVVDRLEWQEQSGAAQFAFSDNGHLVFSNAAAMFGLTHLVLVGPNGTEVLTRERQAVYSPAMSPDGRRIAVRLARANDDIMIFDVARKTFTRLTFEPGDEGNPIWTPDGRNIIYTSAIGPAEHRMMIKAADGSGEPRVLHRSTVPMRSMHCSNDGSLLTYTTDGEGTRRDVWLLSLRDGKTTPLVRTPLDEFAPSFSPDGKWIAYTSIESAAQPQVFVRSLTPGGGRWQVSTESGRDPQWSSDGRAICFRKGAAALCATVTPSADGLSFGNPEQLMPLERFADMFTLAPDGRVLGVQGAEVIPGANSMTFVENWFADLERRVPAR